MQESASMGHNELIDEFKAGIVDPKKLKGLIDDAFSMAQDAAAVGDVKAFAELTKIIQAQQKLDMSATKPAKSVPSRQEDHKHVHLHGPQPRRSQLANFLERIGVQEAAQSYLSDG